MAMRRSLAKLALTVALALATWGSALAQIAPAEPTLVRLFAVRTEFNSGLLDGLIADFEAQTGCRIERSSGRDTYEELAKAGKS
jgi:ABC-type tungstate transport system permease subunit